MKHNVRIAVTVIVLALTARAQTAEAPRLSDFAGSFNAEFHKKTWLTLTLVNSGNTLTGTLKHAVEISSDDEGDITKVGDEMSSDPVIEVALEGQALEIITKDEDGDQDHYTLTITGPDTADLKSEIGTGSITPKPFKLKRNITPPTNSKAAPRGGSAQKK
jgi:hypothetical protein